MPRRVSLPPPPVKRLGSRPPGIRRAAQAQARDQIRIVGSSTVFPYTQAVAEQFAAMTGMTLARWSNRPAPAAACRSSAAASAPSHPDITGASRAMKKSEYGLCLHRQRRRPTSPRC
jgi:phosphate transport system substrate-binding protein